MRLGKIKPTATIVAQFAAGVEVEAIQHDGKIFMPVIGMGEFAVKDEAPAPTPTPTRKEEPAAPTTKVEETSAGTTSKKYTEDELMDMETKDLLKMCKQMGIDPDATEGKNTNKKLRKLILEAQEGTAAPADEGDDTSDAPASADATDDDELVSSIAEILDDFDEGKKNKKKTINSILDLYEDTNEDDKEVVTKFVEKFEDDADANSSSIAKEIVDALEGEEEVVVEEPKKKGGKGGKEKLVAPEDLEVGDRVSVWWDDDNQEWYDGKVKSISKKGKVVIAYDDDTEDAIDPEVHTKIKLLSK